MILNKIKKGIVKREHEKRIDVIGHQRQMDQLCMNNFYNNKYFPCPVKGCVSEVFAFVFDKYDNELKHLILCTSNKSDKRAKKVPN